MEWNRREFIVKPIMSAGTASVLAKTDLLTKLANDSGPLIQRTLGKTGLTMPVVSMGVMNADIPGLVRRSYELGIRHFDTAAVYQGGRNEEMVGSVIKELGVRDKVIIATKQVMRNPTVSDSKRRFMEGVEASLRRLQMDHVDILYYHSVDSVEDARAEGRADALLTVLRVRGIAVPDAARDRILAQKDPAQTKRWLERAMVASRIAEVIDDTK